ncbi:toxin glutamine deamidase domain-containing protein, partial [Streptomyces beijiangensis]
EDGPWVQHINGEGTDAPGRNNNCVDVALSTADTLSGNPTAAAARTPDTGPDGLPSDRGETNGRNRIENALGARFSDMGDGRNAFNRLENTLRDSGHGSQAVIITQDANGRAHAWNAVNHNGRITYIDAQTGRTSRTPLHDGKNGVFAVPLDANRRPVSPQTTPTATDASKSGSSPKRDSPNSPNSPTESRRAPEAPAGAPYPTAEDTPHPRDEPNRTNHPRLGAPETAKSTPHHGMHPMPDQQHLRTTNNVRQVGMDHVHQQLNDWMEPRTVQHPDGTETTRIPLVDALQAGTPPNSADGSPAPVTLRRSDLERLLPGFADMHPGEQGAVVASLARLSLKFHEAHAVGASPEHSADQPSRGAEAHAKAQWPARNRDEQELKDSIIAEFDKSGIAGALRDSGEHRPDFTGRNYAVIEVHDPTTGEISYLVDSSYPNVTGEKGKHSESNILDYLEKVNATREDGKKYEPLSLYTDREPCGFGQGHANCSNALSQRIPGVDVFYGTGYRKNGELVDGASPGVNRKALYDRDLAKNMAALGKVWVRAMGEGGLRVPAQS